MKRLRAVGLVWWGALAIAAAAEPLVLDGRLRADRDLIMEQVQDTVTDIRVIEDRGLIAKAASNGARFPATRHAILRQRDRYTSGAAQPDGSVPITLSVLGRRESLRLASGQEQPVDSQPQMDKVVFKAVIDPQGRVLPASIQIEGISAESQESAKAMLVNVLEQATRVEPLRIEEGKAAQQTVDMVLPLPGLPALNLNITASNRLIGITDGIAKIEMVYVMAFGVPQGPVKITASGSGGGTLLYDIVGQVVRSTESNTLMTLVVERSEGTLELQINTRQTQTIQDAAR